ncbi:group II intron reverse transcriptase/maturase [Enterococcus raffinosus]|uniref:group II intron reverse transcriptase/maturase n=1 Tax=Enterococcus raffinosus TaxID=71452 RepID=UPI003B983905
MPRLNTKIRYWEYYDLQETFDQLFTQSRNGKKFYQLYELIISENNILLAYRTIKANKGSSTPGTDSFTIDNYKEMNQAEFIHLILSHLENYKPKSIKRVIIPKPNGEKRPLGIPCMIDRMIQQMFKQILEPICEAKFYEHSYGFRPLRSAKHALGRIMYLINISKMHYAVDIDIKGFFDNVNHRLLIKQLWNIGICDKQVLAILSKSLKSPIQGEGIPSKGTIQGGIISPLLSNVVLNDLDHWVSKQWHTFETKYPYTKGYNKFRALRDTNLKQGYIVRYADDFKIMTNDYPTALKWFHAVKLYLKDRLKLDISNEKSKIVNLRKCKSEFLGFAICVKQKGKKWVCNSRISNKKKDQIKEEIKQRIKDIQKSPTAQNALLFNALVLGVHNYFRYATHINLDLNRMNYVLSFTTYNRLSNCSTRCYPNKASPTYKKFYSTTMKTYKVAGVYLYPLCDVSTKTIYGFNTEDTPFTPFGRQRLEHKSLQSLVFQELRKLMESKIPNRTVEYLDSRISRYSMKSGKCEITKQFLPAKAVHCHHYLPKSLGGDDKFDNLRIIHKDIHLLIHTTNKMIIDHYVHELKLVPEQIAKINLYRKMCNLQNIQ